MNLFGLINEGVMKLIKATDDIKKWFHAEEDINIVLSDNLIDYEDYPLNDELFIYGDDYVKEKLILNSVYGYFKFVEKYNRFYIQDFSFSNYQNINKFTDEITDYNIISLCKLIKDDAIPLIENLISNIDDYNPTILYRFIKYYSFLVDNALETNNIEGALDFMAEYFYNIDAKTLELTKIDGLNNSDTRTKDTGSRLLPYHEQFDFPASSLVYNAYSVSHNTIDTIIESAEKQAHFLNI